MKTKNRHHTFRSVQAARSADSSFRREVVGHHSSLYRLALALTRNPAASEDLVQETILRALRSAHRFKRGTNLRAWLMGILRNRFADQYRHEAVARSVHIDAVPLAAAEVDSTPSYADLLSWEDIRSAAEKLAGFQREVFTLHYIDHLPYQVIAGRLNIPVSTVGVRLWRARQSLRQVLTRTYQRRLRTPVSRSGAQPRAAAAA